MKKQDKVGVRRASDIERKYELENINKQGTQIKNQDLHVAQLNQAVAQFMVETNARIYEITMSITESNALVEELKKQILSQDTLLQSTYPVGSIYISINPINPADLFGFGEWSQIKDTFLLSAGDTYKAGDTGGEEKHKLTVDEMPKHTHKFAYNVDGATASESMLAIHGESFESGTSEWRATTQDFIIASGGDKEHNNMPPYVVVYIWKRIS